ncbi:ApcC hetero-tetramer Cut9-Hcn1 [Circinella umbellata]|nr:ApcC hetero-tetramer Cut9-Hcn1 [Circinella umbellata]
MPRGLIQEVSYRAEYSREDRLRIIRHDAAQQHLNKTATFFAEKLTALSDDTNDVYFLAQAYYQSQEYERALDLLNKKKTLNKSVQCRYLAGLCAIGLENWHDALDYLGPDNPFADKNAHLLMYDDSRRGNRVLESMMCYARGNAYLQLKEIDKAKSCFKEALKVDVKCYDALDALIEYNMLDERSEWEFIMTLPYDEHCGSDSDLFRSLYMLQLKRYSHTADIHFAQKKAEKDHGLANSLDVMHSTAKTLLAECRYEECLNVCQKYVLKEDALYKKSIPTYITCLYELKKKDELYMLAQELVDRLNEEAVTWHAVGMYNLYIKKYAEARRYFSQATSIDQYFEDSWLGYGHTFAAEKDHDPAISAYLTCSKLIPGSHLPYMYIGVQYMEQNMFETAAEYLKRSLAKCSSDPYLLNEIATYYYQKREYSQALETLRNALKLAKDRQSPRSNLWEKLWANFGHVYRRMRKYDRALKCFRLALDKNPHNSDVHASIGLIYHIQGKTGKALVEYNKVLMLSTVII